MTASRWLKGRLDDVFNDYLAAYQDAWRSFPDAQRCLEAVQGLTRVAVLSTGDQGQQEARGHGQ